MTISTQQDVPAETMIRKFRVSRNATLFCYTALLLLFLGTQIAKVQSFNAMILIIQTAPLLTFIPGLRSQYYRVYSWLCFIILLYFVVAVMESLASNANIGDYMFLVLTVALFIASMFSSRYAQRVQKNIS